MPAYISKRSGSPDTSAGVQLSTVPAQSDSNLSLPVGVAAKNTLGAKPAAHRSGLVGVDTATDMSSAGFGTSLYEINNDAELIVWGEANVSSGGVSITAIPVFYDTAGTPLFEGDTLILTPSTRRVSATGKYLTAFQPISSMGADRVKMFISAINGWWDIFVTSV
jgi:hypothetical protein